MFRFRVGNSCSYFGRIHQTAKDTNSQFILSIRFVLLDKTVLVLGSHRRFLEALHVFPTANGKHLLLRLFFSDLYIFVEDISDDIYECTYVLNTGMRQCRLRRGYVETVPAHTMLSPHVPGQVLFCTLCRQRPVEGGAPASVLTLTSTGIENTQR